MYYAAFVLDPDGNNVEAVRREFRLGDVAAAGVDVLRLLGQLERDAARAERPARRARRDERRLLVGRVGSRRLRRREPESPLDPPPEAAPAHAS